MFGQTEASVFNQEINFSEILYDSDFSKTVDWKIAYTIFKNWLTVFWKLVASITDGNVQYQRAFQVLATNWWLVRDWKIATLH